MNGARGRWSRCGDDAGRPGAGAGLRVGSPARRRVLAVRCGRGVVVSEFLLELDIDGLPKTPNELLHAHWSTVRSNSSYWKWLVRGAVGRRRPRVPLPRASIVFTRYSASEPDWDNLVGSFKPVLDGLVRSKVIEDDKPSNVNAAYYWIRAPKTKGRISIQVREPLED